MIDLLQVIESLAPLRDAPSEAAEMHTQLHFGESTELLEEQPRWLRVRAILDGYEGWIDKKLVAPAPPEWPLSLGVMFVHTPLACLTSGGRQVILGMHAPVPADENGGILPVGGCAWRIADGQLSEALHSRQSLIEQALRMLGAPYLWGGKSLLGIDCSGFTQLLCFRAGVPILRNASHQARQGLPVQWNARQLADLAFFAPSDGGDRVTHVGFVGPALDEILHASGGVRIDRLTPEGIVHSESGQLTHRLVGLRDVLAAQAS